MARNRKHQSAALRFGPALKACLLCLLFGGAGVGYVWQKDQIRQLEVEMKQREEGLKRLITENDKRRSRLDALKSPPAVEQRIRELNLGLVLPQQGQVWTIPEPAPEAAGETPTQYAVQEHGRPTQQ